MRTVLRIVGVLVMASTGIVELYNGPAEVRQAASAFQDIVAWGQLGYGVCGVAGAFGLWRRRRWALPTSAGWAVLTMIVASVASFAYSDPEFSRPDTLTGTISAFLATAVIGALVVWLVGRETRSQPVTRS